MWMEPPTFGFLERCSIHWTTDAIVRNTNQLSLSMFPCPWEKGFFKRNQMMFVVSNTIIWPQIQINIRCNLLTNIRTVSINWLFRTFKFISVMKTVTFCCHVGVCVFLHHSNLMLIFQSNPFTQPLHRTILPWTWKGWDNTRVDLLTSCFFSPCQTLVYFWCGEAVCWRPPRLYHLLLLSAVLTFKLTGIPARITIFGRYRCTLHNTGIRNIWPVGSCL